MLDQIKKLSAEYGWAWCVEHIDWMRVVETLEEDTLRIKNRNANLENRVDQLRRIEKDNTDLEHKVERLENKIDSLNEELYVLKKENKALKDREVLLNSTNHSSHHDNEYHVKVKVGFDEDPDFCTVANSTAYLKRWTSCLHSDFYIYDNDGNKITISVGNDE